MSINRTGSHIGVSPLIAVLLGCLATTSLAQTQKKGEAPLFMDRDDAWFASAEGIEQMQKLVSWQTVPGGWPKAYDFTVLQDKPGKEGTIDNKATTTELRQLARAYRITKRPEFLASFNKGLDFLFTSQYPNGGWPQRFPIKPTNYGHAVTFNDNAIVNVLTLQSDILNHPDFAFVDESTRAKVKQSYNKGLACTLNCQLTIDGKLTAWAQQYDAEKLIPVKARTYELESLASGESSGILVMLMKIENPSPEIQKSIHAGAAWFDSVKILGKKLEKRDSDLFVVEDASAEPLWSRFYEFGTNKPFFVGRDGVKKYDLSEIDKERRNGYAWLRPMWGADVANKYAEWKTKFPQ